MTWCIELFFFEILHVKVAKPRFELVTNIVVSSGGGGTFAVFQIKFVIRFATKAVVVGNTGREKR